MNKSFSCNPCTPSHQRLELDNVKVKLSIGSKSKRNLNPLCGNQTLLNLLTNISYGFLLNKKPKESNIYTCKLYASGIALYLETYDGNKIDLTLLDLLNNSKITLKNNNGYFEKSNITQLLNYSTQIEFNNQPLKCAILIQSEGKKLYNYINFHNFNLKHHKNT